MVRSAEDERPMQEAFSPGTSFANYRVESLLGRGGMGIVHLARDLSLERPVALKLLAPELAQDAQFRARFLREPKLAASLDHPNVIPIYEAGEHEGRLYLAMRYVEGTDLKTALERDGKLPAERTVEVLAQVAGALDAAHARGLVHRDVKPGNVLLDQTGHVYLTDFGITKQVGGESTETGSLVGTLDYLAPEQIRGEPVEASTDCYALACVLYECLAGKPPFRRATEAETLWAHMQDEPPPLRGRPKLDPVLRRGLAKEKDGRYPTCTALIEAAGEALGVAVPRSPTRLPAHRRRLLQGRLLAAGGLLLLVAVGAAGIAALTADDEAGGIAPIGNGVAVIDSAGGRITEFVEAATAPSNIAVGEGAVWVLNTENQTVSRIDPKTKAVTGRFEPRGVPTDIAAGEGALWVGNGGGEGGNYTVSVSRVDPKTSAVTHTVKLPDRTRSAAIATFNWGHPDIVVGAGAVWTHNPDHTVSRIDPDTGRLVKTFDIEGEELAAGEEGVWVVSGPGVTRIDPRTNRVGQTIPLGTDASAVAVGAGKVWVPSARDGVVWRVEPGRQPITRAIRVGVGVEYIAFGAGAVWAGNFIDGKLSRIDPRANAITQVPVGAVQALAAGAGGAWVSTAGRPEAGTLPALVCGETLAGGRHPDVLITSDLPLQGPLGAGPRALADAIRLVLKQRDYTAGKYAVGYRSCDDSTAQTAGFENRRCAANANAYAHAERLVAVIGPYNSDCAGVEIPILNRAPGGPLAMISPSNTDPGLTRPVREPASSSYRDVPEVYYPTGIRNFFRLPAGDDLGGVAYAILAKRLRLKNVYVLADDPSFWGPLLTHPFRRAARKLGVRVAGSATFDPRAKSYDSLVDAIARSRAQGVVIGGNPRDGGDRLVKALRARFGARLTIMGGFLFFPGKTLERIGRAAHGLYMTTTDLPRAVLPLSAAGRRFKRQLGAPATEFVGVMEAGQAAELVMDAIARSDGTRASVLQELRASEVRNGILGSFRFDPNGDTTTASVPIIRITGSTPPGSGLPDDFQGGVVDLVVKVPPRLAE
jgi:ABC-type branched-subunit amino acid transport system substrate-binding protein/DNA-binding beta-propeller fold protein YncE